MNIVYAVVMGVENGGMECACGCLSGNAGFGAVVAV